MTELLGQMAAYKTGDKETQRGEGRGGGRHDDPDAKGRDDLDEFRERRGETFRLKLQNKEKLTSFHNKSTMMSHHQF